MSETETVITLPNREEMMERLLKVNDASHLQQKFYPHLLKHAGQERVPHGIVVMLALAINDYTTGMPAIMVNSMYMQATKFIEALVVDPEIAGKTNTILKEVLATA